MEPEWEALGLYPMDSEASSSDGGADSESSGPVLDASSLGGGSLGRSMDQSSSMASVLLSDSVSCSDDDMDNSSFSTDVSESVLDASSVGASLGRSMDQSNSMASVLLSDSVSCSDDDMDNSSFSTDVSESTKKGARVSAWESF